MANSKIVLGITAIVSLGIGAVGGYIIGSHVMKKRCDEIITQLNDEVNDYAERVFMHNTGKEMSEKPVKDYTNYYKTLSSVEKKMFDEAPDKEAFIRAKEMVKKNEELTKKYYRVCNTVENNKKIVKENLESDEEYEARIREEKGIDPDDESDFAHRLIDEGPDKTGVELLRENPLPPYMIDQNEYEDNQFSMFSKQEYTYFGDGTLIDENDNIVDDPDGLIGVDNLIELDDDKTNVIFVRNEAISADFEIVYKEMTYNEFMGVTND